MNGDKGGKRNRKKRISFSLSLSLSCRISLRADKRLRRGRMKRGRANQCKWKRSFRRSPLGRSYVRPRCVYVRRAAGAKWLRAALRRAARRSEGGRALPKRRTLRARGVASPHHIQSYRECYTVRFVRAFTRAFLPRRAARSENAKTERSIIAVARRLPASRSHSLPPPSLSCRHRREFGFFLRAT